MPRGKLINRIKDGRLSMKSKLYLSFSALAVVLFISSVISIMEYRSMSSYVSDMIADNIRSVNIAQKLSDSSNSYNLSILAVIGDEASHSLPPFDAAQFKSHCDSLRSSLSSKSLLPLADSVEYAYSAYMLTSLELRSVILSDFIDTRSWYFERLQPRFNRLERDIEILTEAIYEDLSVNSENFESGFYRSIIPGIVAVGVGLVLLLLLVYFLSVYYVTPIYKMLSSLKNYRSYGSRYNYKFEGDDQLAELNEGISEVASENHQLHKRISAMRASSKTRGE